MKRSTRILSIIMAIAMIVSSMVVVASAEATPTIAVQAGEIVDGQVSVTISLVNNPGVVSVALDLVYDEGLTLVSATDAGFFGDNYTYNDDIANNPYAMIWSDGAKTDENGAAANYEGDGVLATLVFDVTDEPGDYTVTVNYDAENHGIINAAEENVAFEVEAATITVEEPYVAVESVELDATEATLTEGDTLQLTATVTPTDATEPAVTWASDAEGVATVVDGVVTAIAAGTANITATAGDITATCVVTVEAKVIPVTGITLDQEAVTLTEGEEITLVATVDPETATDKTVVWASDAEGVATVVDGVVTAIAAGTANITATAGDFTATCVVTVEKAVVAVTNITLDQTAVTLTEGEEVTLAATVTPDDATDKTVTWASDAEGVATVVDGVVTAIAAGTANITATAGDFTATCVVTVNAAVVEPEPEEPVAMIGETPYASVAAALAAAQDGDEVVMVADAVEGGLVIKPGVTLNLAAYTLEAEYVVGLKGSSIYGTAPSKSGDGTDGGVLKVAKDNIVLPEEGYKNTSGQYMLPVWNPNTESYVFSLIVVNTSASTKYGFFIDEENQTLTFVYKPQATTWVLNNLLKTGASDKGLKYLVRLTWETESGTAMQDFVFNAEQEVTMANGYGGVGIKGYGALEIVMDTLEVYGVVVSDSGSTAFGSVWNIDNAKS